MTFEQRGRREVINRWGWGLKMGMLDWSVGWLEKEKDKIDIG